MAPEYGATMGFFPVDAETLNYLRRTGRSDAEVAVGRTLHQGAGTVPHRRHAGPQVHQALSLDLGTVEPSLAGPKRPQDRVPLAAMKQTFEKSLRAPVSRARLRARRGSRSKARATVRNNGQSAEIGHGAVVIAAITSCTNTSNPAVMLAAGLLARRPWPRA